MRSASAAGRRDGHPATINIDLGAYGGLSPSDSRRQAGGFRQYLLRGIEKVAGERSLICTAHNLQKLAAVRV